VRILVTRPDEAGRRTADRLKALGHEPVLLPLMAAEHHPDIVREALSRPHAALALTSAEAVRVLVSLGEDLAPYLDDTVLAVGEATAVAALDAGFRNVQAADGTGAGMVETFGAQLARLTRAAPLLYLAGTPRSPALEAGLAERGFPVLLAESYFMRQLPIDAEDLQKALEPEIDAVLLYSRETARRFFDLAVPGGASEVFRNVSFLCLSPNIAEAVPGHLRQNTRCAIHPDEESLFALL
jgi:uroporphyrinogen-III synthase